MLSDFNGWASYYEVWCLDGRYIKKGAFRDCDGLLVPLLKDFRNLNDPDQVIGHVELFERKEGLYSFGYFNEKGGEFKEKLKKGEIKYLGIYANQIKTEKDKFHHCTSIVLKGTVRAVALVTSPSNPKAIITKVNC